MVEVWPENAQALEVFAALQTQWRVGMAGPTGLDYAVLPAVMDLTGVPAPQRPELFNDLRVMETEALRVIADRNGRK